VRSPENIDAVKVALQRNPSESTRRAAAELGISRRSLQRILKSDLNMCPYKMTVLPKLIIQACNEITEDMCRQVINNITVRVEEVARRNGGHIEHLIHRG
jgi:AraC-like DNA-binding protein